LDSNKSDLQTIDNSQPSVSTDVVSSLLSGVVAKATKEAKEAK